jgi:epoxyqueuosine reductase QueG
MNENNLKLLLDEYITDYVAKSPSNDIHVNNEPVWGRPLTAAASGNDPLFIKYKSLIGDCHWTPAEILSKTYPDYDFYPENISVLSWVLPQTAETLSEQRKQHELPAKRWIHARHYGEMLNDLLRKDIETKLRKMGIRAVSPSISPLFDYRYTEPAGICSNWSERHAAFAAGLGTFSLSDGFISEAGIAIRIGSVVLEAALPVSKSGNRGHMDNCLFAHGKCGVCMKRCPVGAITDKGHNKEICKQFLREVTKPYGIMTTGIDTNPCGLCQAGVPCEKSIPVK